MVLICFKLPVDAPFDLQKELLIVITDHIASFPRRRHRQNDVVSGVVRTTQPSMVIDHA